MDLPQERSYFLEPGYIFFSKQAATIRTVVGSCVAVCLWDKQLRYGGMSHFVRPAVVEADRATAQYGNVATAALVRIMEEAGCQRADLIAQILGGGAPEDSAHSDLGLRNVEVARDVLKRKGIRIVAEDIGGAVGRKVLFDTGTGQLAVLKVQRIRQTDWIT